MKYLVMTMVLLLVAGSLLARDLTLPEALELARQHSFELKKSQALADAARQSGLAAERGRFPTLSLEGRANWLSNLPSFEISLPTGQSLQREIGSQQNYQADVRLQFPLYTGGRLSGTIDQAAALAQMREALSDATLDQVYLAARIEFFSLARAESMLRAATASLKRATITEETIQSMYDAGAADSVDLLETRLAVSQASFAKTQSEIDRRTAELRLLLLLGLDTDSSLTVAGVTDSVPPPMPREPVPTDMPQLRSAQAGINAGKASVGIEKSGYLPSLSLFGGYSVGKPNRDVFNGNWDDYFTIGAGVSWSFNLGNQTGRRVKATEFQLHALEQERDRIHRDLTEAARLAYEQMSLAHERFQSADDQYQITSTNYRLAQHQHEAGALTTRRLLEIEQSLTSAEATLAASRAEFRIAQSRYLYAIGSDKLEKGTDQ